MGFGDNLPEVLKLTPIHLPPETPDQVRSDEVALAVRTQSYVEAMGQERYVDYLVENYFDKEYTKEADLSYLYYTTNTLKFMYKPTEKAFYIQDRQGRWKPIRPQRVELIMLLLMESDV